MRETIDRKGMSVLSSGHLATDFASGSVPALLPFFTVEVRSQLHADRGPDARRARLVVADAAALRALVRPPRRALAAAGRPRARRRRDRPRRRGAELRPCCSCSSSCSGIGIAAFHPEGAKFAVFLSGTKRASGMSLFNIGGNLGYALGPIVVTPLVLWLGLGPGRAAGVGPGRCSRPSPCSARCRTSRGQRPERGARLGAAAGAKDDVRAMVILAGVIGLRSVAWFALLTFVPLWAVSLGNSEAEGNRLLSLMLLSGAVGTLLLGPIADRFGIRRTLLVAQALLTPLILVFVLVGGVAGAAALVVVGDLRRRHVRSHDGAEPDVSPAARRHGLRALGRARDGSRRDRRRRARGGRRRRRSRDGAHLQRARAAARGRALLLPAGAEPADARLRRPRPRHTLCSTDSLRTTRRSR